MKILLICLFLAVSANAWFFPNKASYKRLYVTFKKFNRLPVTQNDAVSKGWKLTKGCDASNAFAGNRYVLDGDTAVMLLMDNKGLLAGMQMGVPKTKVGTKKAPWVSEGEVYVITAYFKDPSTICGGGKRQRRHAAPVYGDRLLIQNSPSISDTTTIPYHENGLKGTNWVKGKCFPLMGNHYWYGISKNMNCDDFYPVFLLYNGGTLDGFGWNTQGDLKSSRYEHPPKDKLNYFFKDETRPTCLSTRLEVLTTQHIYLGFWWNNFCYVG